MPYPKSYHEAASHLLQLGTRKQAATGRAKIARALRDIRREFGTARAMWERRSLLYIAGCFPSKAH